jgi:hypothetical protein
MCFFHCAPCALQYPLAVGLGEIDLAGWPRHEGLSKTV